MGRPIDAEDLRTYLTAHSGMRTICENCTDIDCLDCIVAEIDRAPTIDDAIVVHGQWEKHPNMYGFVRCSECRDCVVWDEWVNNEKWKYCPNCGAKMDKGEEDGQS